MAVKEGLMTTTQLTGAKVREIDIASRFGDQWDALRAIWGIMRPIRKVPGTKLTSYKVELDGGLKGGDTVGEGEEIPLTKVKFTPVAYSDVVFHKYLAETTIEAVDRYGGDDAVEKSDNEIVVSITKKILEKFYAFLLTGTLTRNEPTWQRALAMAKGSVLDKFAEMDKAITDIVGFANLMDLYDYLGDKDITVQTAFGLNYVKDFLGYSTLFLLPDKYIPKGKVVATPVENIVLYYADPSESDYAKLGLNFTVQGETNLIGVHIKGDYRHVTGYMTAIYAMQLWAEYLDGIAIVTVGNASDDTGGGTEPANVPEAQNDTPEENDTLNETADLSTMTKDELLSYAAENGVTGVSSADTKAQIIAAIEAAM